MTSRQAKVVSSYKGLDREIFASIDLHKRERFFSQLAKELYIIAETASKGAGEKLEILIRKYLENQLSFSQVRNELNALIEIGKNFDQLDKTLKEIVYRAEIQQEFYHFSRIMGHDRILEKSSSISEQELMNEVRDFARFLVLVLERRAERGINSKILPFYHGAGLSGNVSINSNQVVLRNKKLNVNGVIFCPGNSKQNRETAKEALIVFEKLLEKYSFDVSCALLDYYCFLKPDSDRFSFFAAQEYQEKGARKLRIFNVGSNACMILARPKQGEFFEKEVVEIISNEGFDGQKLGTGQALNFGLCELALPDRGSYAVIANEDWSGNELTKPLINESINNKDERGKVHPQNNLAQIIGTTPLLFDFGFAEEIEKFKWNKKSINKALEKIDFSEIVSLDQDVSVEAGHIHADRRLGQVQIDGINIAAKFVALLKEQTKRGIENIAMVDEYHVVNSLDYHDYLQNLNKRSFAVQELVYESSPLILEIALDVFKLLFEQANKDSQFEILFEGDSVYLKFSKDSRVVELIEGVSGNFSLGCVLFEVGLCLYKRYRDPLIVKYQKLHNLPEKYDIHQAMTGIYLQKSSIEQRSKAIDRLLPKLESDFQRIIESKNDTPYWNDILGARKSGNQKALVNVLEDFYQPQQKKLNKILGLIGEQEIFSLYFNNNQEIYLKRS